MTVFFHKPPHGPPGQERQFLAECFDRFRRDRGISVDYSEPLWENWHSSLPGLAEDGKTHLFYIPDGWLPALASQGIVTNLSAHFPEHVRRWKEEYPESIFGLGEVGGCQFGIPVYGAVWCFMYNGHLFEKAGILTAPVTWEELMECAEKLKMRFPDLSPYGINDDSDGHFVDHGYVYLFAGGQSEWHDHAGRLRFDNEGSVKGLSFFRELVERGLANMPIHSPSDRIMEQFLDGKIAMTVGPSDWILRQRQRFPHFPMRTAMMPCPQGGKPVSFASYGFYCIASGSDDIDDLTEAVKLLDELVHPGLLKQHIETIGMLPVKNGFHLYKEDKEMSVFSRQMKWSGVIPNAEIAFSTWLIEEMLACLRLEKSAVEALSCVTELMCKESEQK